MSPQSLNRGRCPCEVEWYLPIFYRTLHFCLPRWKTSNLTFPAYEESEGHKGLKLVHSSMGSAIKAIRMFTALKRLGSLCLTRPVLRKGETRGLMPAYVSDPLIVSESR